MRPNTVVAAVGCRSIKRGFFHGFVGRSQQTCVGYLESTVKWVDVLAVDLEQPFARRLVIAGHVIESFCQLLLKALEGPARPTMPARSGVDFDKSIHYFAMAKVSPCAGRNGIR